MTHTSLTHRTYSLGVLFTSLALVFAVEVATVRNVSTQIRVLADAAEILPPKLPRTTTVRPAAPGKKPVVRRVILRKSAQKPSTAGRRTVRRTLKR